MLASQVLGSALLRVDGSKANPAGPCLEGSVSPLEGDEAAASGWAPLCPPLEGRQADASGTTPQQRDLQGRSWSSSPPSNPPQEEARPFSSSPLQASSPWGGQLSRDSALQARRSSSNGGDGDSCSRGINSTGGVSQLSAVVRSDGSSSSAAARADAVVPLIAGGAAGSTLSMEGRACHESLLGSEDSSKPLSGSSGSVGLGSHLDCIEEMQPEAHDLAFSTAVAPPESHGLRRRAGGFPWGLCCRAKAAVGIAAGLAILPFLLRKLTPLRL